jgi:tetratricopeptide (TPR) repeat protein
MTARLRMPVAALLALLAFWPLALQAATLDRDALADRLFERLAAATTEEQGRRAEDAVWQMWIDHPDEGIRDAIALGMRQRESYEWDRALETFSRVIERDPDYAEGWNQRAFIHFLKEDLDASFADLERALELEPRHFGALAGKALIFMQTGRFGEGQAVLRQAVAIHPFLKERRMLVPE